MEYRVIAHRILKETPMSKYKVWVCKIVVSGDAKLPDGFDGPPRLAAIQAVESAGIVVWDCFSGWGGILTETQEKLVRGRQLGLGE